MLRLTSKNPEGWKAVAGALSSLMDEATFHVAKDGITIRGMDPSHVAMIDIFMNSSLFESYECDSDTKFSVRLADLAKMLKRADKKDTLQVTLTDDSMLQFLAKSVYSKEFRCKLIESTASLSALPKLDHKVKIGIPAAVLENVLADLAVSGEHAKMDANNGVIEFSTRGDAGEAKIGLDGEAGISVEAKEQATATYSLDYLQKFFAAAKASGTVYLEFSTKMPLQLNVSVEQAAIHFYLAPRVAE